MATRFGGDCTKSSLENRFRRIKTDATMINKAVKMGIDPITLNIGGADGVAPIKGGSSFGQVLSFLIWISILRIPQFLSWLFSIVLFSR
jgi:hypothetical protein